MAEPDTRPLFLLEETGELRIDPHILDILTRTLCRYFRVEHLAVIYKKIRRECRIRIKLPQPHHNPELISVPKSLVKLWTRSLNLVAVPGLYSDLDLDSGKYEGGFKVWESTVDLIRFITEDQDILNRLLHNRRGRFKALELGAGSALPSLALLDRIIRDQEVTTDYSIHLQDYNWEVLASLTLMNFATNLPQDYLRALLDTKSLRFYYGDWSNFRAQSNYKYNLIIMSEVIYNANNYEALHDLLDRHLTRDGYVVIATKDTYFGLSGGLYAWLDFIHDKQIFRALKRFRVQTMNIPRSILIITR